MLVEDESDYFEETLRVYENEVSNLRGRIRPVPPPVDIVNGDICYGRCVDVHYNDCWWEGVIFDCEDGSGRNVFFPELADEMLTPVANTRISQDWNDVSGLWKNRGKWFFLESLEQLEDANCFHFKPKEFWLELRQKDKFQKLGDWTCDDKELWNILVLETFGDKLKHFMGRISNLTHLPELQGLVESANFINVQTRQPDVSVCQEAASVLPHVSVCQEAVSVLPQDLSAVPGKQNEKFDTHSSDKVGVVSSSGGNNISGEWKPSNSKKNNWLPAGSDMVTGAEFCPDAITKYLQKKKKHEVSCIVDVRKHLLHLRWKIEYLKQEQTRLRYTSPDGKAYYALRQVCLFLNDHGKRNSSITQDEKGGPLSCSDDSPSPLSEELPENQVPPVSSNPNLVYIEPEYCPEAALEWYTKSPSMVKKRKGFTEMTWRAKKHLSAVGWKFKRVDHSGRLELRYISPEGKIHNSLRAACMASIGTSASTSRRREAVSKVQADAACQRSSLRILKSRKRKKRLQSSSLDKQLDISDARKTRSRVLRTRKRVKQVADPDPSDEKPLTVLSWLIDNNIVLPRAKVHFYSGSDTHSTAGGRITREGIQCNCCCEVYNLRGFKFHVSGDYDSPAANIFLEDGRSLLDCQKKLIHKEMEKFVEKPVRNLKGSPDHDLNDDICSICQDGGALLLCDGCPSSFHNSCIGLVDIPKKEEEWFCPSCCCKICGHNKLKVDTEFSIEDAAALNCTQCKKKYHIWCIRNKGDPSLKMTTRENWYCTKKCKEIFSGLNELLGKPIPAGSDNLTWTLLKLNHSDSHKLDAFNDEAWIENCSKLNMAVDMMHECFEPVKDPYSKRDLLRDVIFNRRANLKRLNFEGFYTIVLQKEDEFISVATIRVWDKLAELPLVATRLEYRRVGMCRKLMNVLEKKLMELGIERIVLPAVSSVLNTWTGPFGFSEMMDSEKLALVDHIFLNFQGTVMCHKKLMQIPFC
ncbi:uncharacterized protein [Euphorbia lathyris]|uniref:uncharacterized protein n=1 Tax=Euphorbia lathyris TaxID=212925 RepID=UPI003313373D